jgi:phosphoglycerol transferase MdoB-like AlkP superfamily enzyme
MEYTKTNTSTISQYLTIALITILACFALFSLDKDTHSISDLLTPQNLIALLFYFLPTFIISVLLFELFSKKNNRTKSITLSLVTGIPISFLIVICFFLAIRH